MNILVTNKKKGDVYAIIDIEDYHIVSKYNWYLDTRGYVVSKCKGKVLYMHILILSKKEGYVIDHKDGNKLNNKRENLRHLTVAQNSQNVKLDKEFIGISYLRGKYQVNCSNKYLGVYKTKEEAAKMYDIYVICHINKEGRLNFKYTDKEKEDIIKKYYGSFDKDITLSNISIENDTYYCVNFDNKYVGKIKKRFKYYDDALSLRNEIISKIEYMKKQDLYSLEIERNKEGQAIIKVFNKTHNYEFIIDDKFWYEIKAITKCVCNDKYLRLTINNKKIILHKYLILKYGGYTEEDLKDKVIDHINRNSLDNRLENLRILTPSDNNKNRDIINKTGYRGIYKDDNCMYQAKFIAECKAYYSKKYSNINKAILRYNDFVLKYGKGDLLILNKIKQRNAI